MPQKPNGASSDPLAAPVRAIPARHGLESIVIKGAREHNLKNIDLTLPRNQLIVITGLSGSGKSSLAFDTIYAEGQRRYVESLSSYARQFLGQMEKPDVDYIEGLSPAISIDQKSASHNPRSTVGTVTEIYDYLRLLYARVGKPHCPNCGRSITPQTAEQIVDQILKLPEGTRIQLLAPIVRGRKGEYQKLFEQAVKDGYARVRVDGEIRELREKITLDKKRKHTVEIVIDRLVMKEGLRKRLTDSVETALRLTQGLVTALVQRPNAKEKPCRSPKNCRASTAGCRSRSSPRACSRSTRPTALAPIAPGSASRSRSIRVWSSPIAPRRSAKARSCRGPRISRPA